MASNSLLEGLVCGYKCGELCGTRVEEFGKNDLEFPDWEEGHAVDPKEAVVITQNWEEIRRVMQNYVGIVKADKWLKRLGTG